MKTHAVLINKWCLIGILGFSMFSIIQGPGMVSGLDPRTVETINKSKDIRELREEAKDLAGQLDFSKKHDTSYMNLFLLVMAGFFGVTWMNLSVARAMEKAK
jgi:hypothetical protein